MKIDKDILHRYTKDQCTDAERELVETWFENEENDRSFDESEVDTVVALLDKKILKTSKVKTLVRWSSVAAAIVIIGLIFFWYNQSSTPSMGKFASLDDIKAPNSSHAILVLEDDSEYPLDDIRHGDTLRVKGYAISRLASGELQYIKTAAVDKTPMHTLKTERGGLASVQLTDGTKIWINSGSQIKYPVGHSENREVYLIGEGYFEVNTVYEENQKTPFTVHGQGRDIQVLGTKFNADFTTKNRVALLEGKVTLKIGNNKVQPIIMTAGQLYENSKLITSNEIDRYIDWKEGYFDLRKLNIYDLGSELSNWYRISVQVDQGLPNKQLFGRINRNQDIKQVLEILEKVIPIHYEWKDNTLFINKKTDKLN
ncbi:FecR family protein [Sphingobacterium athyrii]|uniref:FecR family protein n=1 Tax=Sphingobacterium athyrii TaxID=2152717 RepID=UPI0028AA0D83|nr:FecR family protein [Sphingobacterium athyrii]